MVCYRWIDPMITFNGLFPAEVVIGHRRENRSRLRRRLAKVAGSLGSTEGSATDCPSCLDTASLYRASCSLWHAVLVSSRQRLSKRASTRNFFMENPPIVFDFTAAAQLEQRRLNRSPTSLIFKVQLKTTFSLKHLLSNEEFISEFSIFYHLLLYIFIKIL